MVYIEEKVLKEMETLVSSQESATKFQLNLQIHRLTSGDCSKASSTWKKTWLRVSWKIIKPKRRDNMATV